MAPTAWNNFVKKIFHEGRKKNPNFSFREALMEASKRKGEMGSSSSSASSKKHRKHGGSRRRSRRARRSRSRGRQ